MANCVGEPLLIDSTEKAITSPTATEVVQPVRVVLSPTVELAKFGLAEAAMLFATVGFEPAAFQISTVQVQLESEMMSHCLIVPLYGTRT
jgi:hypothetical protein